LIEIDTAADFAILILKYCCGGDSDIDILLFWGFLKKTASN
jgi:hypothetical protein